jgi:hypothetical protein
MHSRLRCPDEIPRDVLQHTQQRLELSFQQGDDAAIDNALAALERREQQQGDASDDGLFVGGVRRSLAPPQPVVSKHLQPKGHHTDWQFDCHGVS